MSKHTPGPWRVVDVPGEASYITARDDFKITRQGYVSPEDTANARLIAAAPDLLDLARNVAGLDPAYVEKIDGPVLVVAAIREWIEQARAAIAKAEGCCQFHASGGDKTLSCGGDIAKAEEKP